MNMTRMWAKFGRGKRRRLAKYVPEEDDDECKEVTKEAVVDSDFDIDEDDEPVSDPDADEGKPKRQNSRLITKAYKEPAPGSKKTPERKKKKKEETTTSPGKPGRQKRKLSITSSSTFSTTTGSRRGCPPSTATASEEEEDEENDDSGVEETVVQKKRGRKRKREGKTRRRRKSSYYDCRICNRTIKFKFDYQRHLTQVHGEKKYPCPKCGHQFTRAEDQRRHLKGKVCKRRRKRNMKHWSSTPAASLFIKTLEKEKRRKPLSEIEVLNLDNCPTTSIEGLTEELVNLRSLSICSAGITSLKGFPKLGKLRKLELSGNRISGGLQVLTACPRLTILNLSNNKIKDFDTLEPMKELKTLKSLDLYRNEVTQEEEYRQKVFTLLPELAYLDSVDRNGKDAESESENDDEVKEMNGKDKGEEDKEEEDEGGKPVDKDELDDTDLDDEEDDFDVNEDENVVGRNLANGYS